MENASLINKLQDFLNDHDIKVDQELLSTSLKELNFSKTLGLLDMIKDRDMSGVAELLNINYDAPVDEAYGTVGTQQPSASAIKAQRTADINNQRDYTNNQQDLQRDSTAAGGKVAGGVGVVATGQGAIRSAGADPDDIERKQNQAQARANAEADAKQDADIERLKALAFGRR